MTMGEITLEDFLTKAGVVREEIEVEPSSNSNNSVVTGVGSSSQTSKATSSEGDWLNFQLKNNIPHQHLFQYQHQVVEQSPHQNINYQVENTTGFPGMLLGPPNAVATALPSSTNSNGFDTQYSTVQGSHPLAVPSRKQYFDINEEKPIDPRQKRMIKNRESAARSRARKQVGESTLIPQMSLFLFILPICLWSFRNGRIGPNN
jgi:ABA responsive element binding factor